MQTKREGAAAHGWRIVAAAFVLAMFGWGLGFYGPPVYLHAVREARGWPVAIVSTAVTVHFLAGAIAVANLPAVYRRYGVAIITKFGALALSLGVIGWAVAAAPWQLLAATLVSGIGWAATGAAALNAIVSPWFTRQRPAALSMAYNGASIGGVVFSPLWVVAISQFGFPLAAVMIGGVMALTVWVMSDRLFSRIPDEAASSADRGADGAAAPPLTSPQAKPLPGSSLWHDRSFLTLAAGMAFGLFAQIGLVAHLFSLLVPALGATAAGLAMGAATASAILGRTLVGWVMPAGADRRLVACISYVVQIAGAIALIFAAGTHVPLLVAGVLLFGAGIGNATSLPPLIAQVEFAKGDVLRVVALIVAVAQGGYAFAPLAFGLIREFAPRGAGADVGDVPLFFLAAAILQALAIVAFLLGRRHN